MKKLKERLVNRVKRLRNLNLKSIRHLTNTDNSNRTWTQPKKKEKEVKVVILNCCLNSINSKRKIPLALMKLKKCIAS